MNKPTKETKFKTVLEKNTFYFYNRNFEEKYEGYLNSLKEILLILKNKIEMNGLKKEFFENLLIEKENGLRSLLALTGLSNETLKRLITIVRIQNDNELNSLVYKNKWFQNDDTENLKEWTDSQIYKLIKSNEHFRKGIVNIFFEGSTIPFLAKTIPLFELKKIKYFKIEI